MFRLEVLGACFITQLLGGAAEASGVVHVDLQCAVDCIPLSCIQLKPLIDGMVLVSRNTKWHGCKPLRS